MIRSAYNTLARGVVGARRTACAMHFIDIGANLTDSVFSGEYNGRQYHEPDIDAVLSRARSAGVVRTVVTAGTLFQTGEAAFLSAQHQTSLWSTAGLHPTRSNEAGEDAVAISSYMLRLRNAIAGNKERVVAIGECGLDYDREQFSPRTQQIPVFEAHFDLADDTKLPLFLHNRNTGGDFVHVVRQHRHRFEYGVVHSFTGDVAELRQLLELGLYIGINGCSLKTEDNLAAVREVPLDRLMLETDAPYCGIKRTHASYVHVKTTFPQADKKKQTSEKVVKGRCEPCQIVQVCEVVAAVKGVSEEEVARAAFNNTMRVFFPNEAADMGDSPYDISMSAAVSANT